MSRHQSPLSVRGRELVVHHRRMSSLVYITEESLYIRGKTPFTLNSMTQFIPSTIYGQIDLNLEVLWRAFLFLGLWFFLPFFLFLAWWPPLLFLVRIFYLNLEVCISNIMCTGQ
jgi:hypothetical protein